MKAILVVATLLLTLILSTILADDTQSRFLIRHAEKQSDGSRNPPLTKVGIQRAINLATLLENKSIVTVFSSNYKRTLETAEPLSKLLGIKTTIYDPGKLREFAKQLKTTQGNVLVVGHSNTTPELVDLLGGSSGKAIEESEYGRLYQLNIINGKVVTTVSMIEPKQ